MISRRSDRLGAAPRVLVLSMYFAPCREVGGKRFSFLSRYLAGAFPEYHVLARRERDTVPDQTAFTGNVYRCRMFPWFPWAARAGLRYALRRAWAKWMCQVDPYIGWVPFAIVHGVRLVRKHDLNVIVITVPPFSGMVAAILVSKITRARLVIDYRDEWTNNVTRYRPPFGKMLSRAIERAGVRQASGIVFCTDVMRREFKTSFGSISRARQTVIYNGFEKEDLTPATLQPAGATNMVYAGALYGNRQLSLLAPAIAELLRRGSLSADTFRIHVYSKLSAAQREETRAIGLESLVELHDPVPYDEIRRIFRGADILFLPSGDEVNYAVPFKFFDYLSAGKPMLAVASRESAVYELMQSVDCGEFAEIGDDEAIAAATERLIQRNRNYTFEGADGFMWRHAAALYQDFLENVAADSVDA